MKLTTCTTDPLGYTALGTPIWPLLGAEGDGDGGQGGGDGDGDGDGDGSGDGLNETGRAAIERERQATRKARDELRPYKSLAKEFGLTIEQMRERLSAKPAEKPDETPVDVEAVRREAETAANDRANRRIIAAEVRSAATATFVNPADAATFVDLEQFEVDEAGNVDSKAIQDALKGVLKERPYLGKKGQPADFDGGGRKTADKPAGMSELIRNAAASRGGGR